MALTKYTLGQLIEQYTQKCGIAKCETVSGINIYKQFMPSRNVGVDTSGYLIVPEGHFAFNLMHVGRDEKIPVALNDTSEDIIVSSAYFVFKVIDESIILKEYLYILMNSNEFDRFAWFCTDSSVRGNLDWNRFCEIEVDLPPISVQEKFVAVYIVMKANQAAYERGLDDLKLVCDAYIGELKRDLPLTALAEYIVLSEERNGGRFGVAAVRGLATSKAIIPTKADLGGVGLDGYKVVKPGSLAYVPDTSRRAEKISLGFNSTNETFLVSSISTVFSTKEEKLLPAYLMLFFCSSEFDRYVRFHSWGSARETFNWDDMQAVKIPIPDIKTQQAIVDIYNAYLTRRELNERLKAQIKDLCPILIKGSLKAV